MQNRPLPIQSHQSETAILAEIYFPPVLPLFQSPPDEKALEQWVKSHHQFPEAEKIAKKASENLNYISFEKFFAQLKITLADFNEKLKSEDYVLWITQGASSGKLKAGCSDAWVAGLSLVHGGLRRPKAIVTTDTIESYLNRHPTVRNVLILDDAAYSACHIQSEAERVLKNDNAKKTFEGINLFVGIPFLTSKAEDIIEHWISSFKIVFLKHAPIKMLREILSPDEIAYLWGQYYERSVTLTYFDHTYPDEVSTIPNFRNGALFTQHNTVVAQAVKNPSRCVPTIVQPYKLFSPLYNAGLKSALERGDIGKRTQYPLPVKLKWVFAICDIQLPLLAEGYKLFRQSRQAKIIIPNNPSPSSFCPPASRPAQ